MFGATVGFNVGRKNGNHVGLFISGASVLTAIGELEGLVEGTDEGTKVGLNDGDDVGLFVTATGKLEGA